VILSQCRINSFKSILDASVVVDPRITVLVGPNEGGKTNVLRALGSFNLGSELTDDDVCQFSGAYRDSLFPEIQLLFSLSDEECKRVREMWAGAAGHAGGSPVRAEGMNEPAEGGAEAVDQAEPSAPVVFHAPGGIGLSGVRGTLIPSFQTLTITKQGNEPTDFFVHAGQQELVFEDKVAESEFKEGLLALVPKFLYFEDIGLLRGEIGIDDLLGDDKAFDTERHFLRLGGITDLGVLRADPRKRDIAIHNAERVVTEKLQRYWTQDPTRKFHIDVDRDTLRITVSDSTGVYASPEERSLGSRWFMSFYINFAARITAEEENVVLLFDEPGIHVHPHGQRDLLPIFEELAASRQIVYTTHLPFLINRNFPFRIRVVEKKGPTGTIVNNKPHVNRWKAVRSSVGLLAADSFLIGDTCLIVEGVSDHIYVAGLSRFLAEIGLAHLDMNVVSVIPASSASETVAPARFCQAEKVPVVILLDSDNQGDQARAALVRDGFIAEGQVLTVNGALMHDEGRTRTIEDLLPSHEYVEAANDFCRVKVPRYEEITLEVVRVEKDDGGHPLPIASAFSKIFRERGYGDFDKRSVAECFVNRLPLTVNVDSTKMTEIRERYQDFANLMSLVATALARLSKGD